PPTKHIARHAAMMHRSGGAAVCSTAHSWLPAKGDQAPLVDRVFDCAHADREPPCHAHSMQLVRKTVNGALTVPPGFNAQAYLESAGVAKTIARYSRGETIFTQGD